MGLRKETIVTGSQTAKNNPPPADADDKTPKGEIDPSDDGDDELEGKEGAGSDLPKDFASWTDSQKEYLRKLRAESAKRRTQLKELEKKHSELTTKHAEADSRLSKIEKGLKGIFGEENPEAKPEERISLIEQDVRQLRAEKEALENEKTLRSVAAQHNIKDDESFEYFNFLLTKKGETMKDGEELSDEEFDSIVEKVHKHFGTKTGTDKKNSSVDGGDDNPPEHDYNKLTLEQFVRMTVTEKSLMYQKNPAQYKELFAQAKNKKLI